jgi:ferredoxin--NADP+ reductase
MERGRMYKIVEKQDLCPTVCSMWIEAPRIAKKHRPGQFVMIRAHEKGERIPLTVVDKRPDEGTIRIIFQKVGKSTWEMGTYNVGDYFLDVAGPLGQPTHIEKFGTVVGIGGGVGIAPLYPILKGMKEAGNRLITILGARTKELLILEDEMKAISEEVIITTDDGSYGKKGLVTDALKELLNSGIKIDQVVTIGPAIMMKFVVKVLEPYQIPCIASLNAMMLDATGMCGVCRVTVGGKVRFVCVDGPEFDGYQVDFDELMNRLTIYKEEEALAFELFKKKHPELFKNI